MDAILERIKQAKTVYVFRVDNVRNGEKQAPVRIGEFMIHDSKKWATTPINIWNLQTMEFQYGIDLSLAGKFHSLEEAQTYVKQKEGAGNPEKVTPAPSTPSGGAKR